MFQILNVFLTEKQYKVTEKSFLKKRLITEKMY